MQEEKKIYIGNLEYGVTESDLRRVLDEKGLNAQTITLISDKYTGRPKGFGFAEFATEDDARKAIESLNGMEFNGRTMKVSKAEKMKPRRENFGGGYNKGSRY